MPRLSRRVNGRPSTTFIALILAACLQCQISAAQTGPANTRGQLVADRAATLAAGLGGTIARIPPALGAEVEEGTVLLALDCSAERASRETSAARVEAARARLAVNERLAELNSVSRLDLDLTRADLRAAQADLRAVDAQLAKCTVRAPFAGTIVDKPVQPFEFVQLGQPVLRLVDRSTLWIDFVAPSIWLRWLTTGREFTITVDETGSTHRAQVVAVLEEVDPVSQSVRVRGTLSDADEAEQLLPGMSGTIRFSESLSP